MEGEREQIVVATRWRMLDERVHSIKPSAKEKRGDETSRAELSMMLMIQTLGKSSQKKKKRRRERREKKRTKKKKKNRFLLLLLVFGVRNNSGANDLEALKLK